MGEHSFYNPLRDKLKILDFVFYNLLTDAVLSLFVYFGGASAHIVTSCILDASTLGRMGVEDGYASVTILFSKPPVVFLRCPKFHPLRVSKRVRVCLPLARSLAV